MGELIRVEDLSKQYGDHRVLDHLNLSVSTAEVVAIIGASGAGKSTLARCIAGLEPADSGEIRLGGQKILSTRDTGGKLGMVFQNFNLFPHYRVLENVARPLMTVRKMSRVAAEEKAVRMLEKVRLADQCRQYPNTLSGGQKQRVAIARALAMEPEILIFDEPTSSLDPQLAREVFETVRDLAREGQTMLIVTHQINAVRHFASRILFLSSGKIEVDGTPDEVFGQCADPVLRDFLRQVEFDDF